MKKEAIKLRTEKRLSNQEIADRLNVSYSTVQKWVQGHPLTKQEVIQKIRFSAKKPNPEFTEKKKLSEKEKALKYFGLGLYAGEGEKTRNGVGICNSDPRVIIGFLRFLRVLYKINERRLRAALQLKDFHDIRKITRYWSKLTGIPAGQFGQPVITKSNPKKDGKIYLGTCRVRYSDHTLLKRILSLIETISMGVRECGNSASL